MKLLELSQSIVQIDLFLLLLFAIFAVDALEDLYDLDGWVWDGKTKNQKRMETMETQQGLWGGGFLIIRSLITLYLCDGVSLVGGGIFAAFSFA